MILDDFSASVSILAELACLEIGFFFGFRNISALGSLLDDLDNFFFDRSPRSFSLLILEELCDSDLRLLDIDLRPLDAVLDRDLDRFFSFSGSVP